MPETTAEKARNRALVLAAMIRASVVFPLPGGPQKTSEGTRSSSIAFARNDSGPTSSGGPTTSGRSRGRIRSARGASGTGTGSVPRSGASSSSSKRPPVTPRPPGSATLRRLVELLFELVERREVLVRLLQLRELL